MYVRRTLHALLAGTGRCVCLLRDSGMTTHVCECIHTCFYLSVLKMCCSSLRHAVTHRQVVWQAGASCLASISWQGQAHISNPAVSVIGAVEPRRTGRTATASCLATGIELCVADSGFLAGTSDRAVACCSCQPCCYFVVLLPAAEGCGAWDAG